MRSMFWHIAEENRLTNQATNFKASWPRLTHWARVSCKEAHCDHYEKGWVTRVEPGSPQEQYIRADKERHHTWKMESSEIVAFFFPAGQRCFKSATHLRKLERGPWLTRGIQSGTMPAAQLERIAMDSDRWMDEYNEASESYNNRR